MPTNKNPHTGQGLTEYSLILGGIAVVLILSLQLLGGNISNIFGAQINPALALVLSAAPADGNLSGQGQSPANGGISLQGSLPSSGPVTINPVTGEIMPDTGGSSSNSNATSGMGQEQVSKTSTGTFQLANTLTQMALSGNYDKMTSNDMLFLAETLYNMGAVEGFLEGHPSFQPSSNYTATEAVNELMSLDSQTQSILTDMRGSDYFPDQDAAIIEAILQQTGAISDSYVSTHTSGSESLKPTKSTLSKLLTMDTIQTEAVKVLETESATEPVLITLDSARFLETSVSP